MKNFKSNLLAFVREDSTVAFLINQTLLTAFRFILYKKIANIVINGVYCVLTEESRCKGLVRPQDN